MKPYIAKYIPVEGKVEIGDNFIDSGVCNMIGKRANKEGVYNYQKVKLMLCSRGIDIKVGDKLIISDGSGTFLVTEFTRVGIRGEITHSNGTKSEGSVLHSQIYNDFFKVIGEISPDATWVKEGDEFDKDEFLIETGFFETVRIKIKCPCCGTFK